MIDQQESKNVLFITVKASQKDYMSVHIKYEHTHDNR